MELGTTILKASFGFYFSEISKDIPFEINHKICYPRFHRLPRMTIIRCYNLSEREMLDYSFMWRSVSAVASQFQKL